MACEQSVVAAPGTYSVTVESFESVSCDPGFELCSCDAASSPGSCEFQQASPSTPHDLRTASFDFPQDTFVVLTFESPPLSPAAGPGSISGREQRPPNGLQPGWVNGQNRGDTSPLVSDLNRTMPSRLQGRWRGLDQPVERLKVGDSWALFTEGEPEFGNAPFILDGLIYTHGCTLDFVTHQCRIARVSLDSVADRSTWRFYDGEGWVPQLDQAAVVFEGGPIVSVGYNTTLDSWLMTYSSPYDTVVVGRVARRPEGPWSDEVPLFETTGEPQYDALHHPELSENDGAIEFITFSRSKGGLFETEQALWRVESAPGAHPPQ